MFTHHHHYSNQRTPLSSKERRFHPPLRWILTFDIRGTRIARAPRSLTFIRILFARINTRRYHSHSGSYHFLFDNGGPQAWTFRIYKELRTQEHRFLSQTPAAIIPHQSLADSIRIRQRWTSSNIHIGILYRFDKQGATNQRTSAAFINAGHLLLSHSTTKRNVGHR